MLHLPFSLIKSLLSNMELVTLLVIHGGKDINMELVTLLVIHGGKDRYGIW